MTQRQNGLMTILTITSSWLLFTGHASWGGSSVSPLMHRNYQALVELEKLAANPVSFQKPSNARLIRHWINELSSVSKTLPQTVGHDTPGLKAISAIYFDYIDDMKLASQREINEYLRNRIRTTANFCMECHTSLSHSKPFLAAQGFVEPTLGPLDKAEFYAATRQFDKALRDYERFFINTDETDVSAWNRALRGALNVTVRAKKDPEATLRILELAEDSNRFPPSLKSEMAEWRKEAQQWRAEAKGPSQNQFKKGEALIERAQKMQTYPLDPSGDIGYLRATNELQEALKNGLKSSDQAKAFYLLGVAYSSLRSPLLWNLQNHYFEAAIRKRPHSSLARQSYGLLEQEVIFSYTGSAGTDLPDEEKTRLDALKALSR